MQKTPQQDLRAAENMNAFFIVPASVKGSIKTIFMTHPPMEKRIERLSGVRAPAPGRRVGWVSSTRCSAGAAS